MIVSAGKKRSLRSLEGVEVEVVSQNDESGPKSGTRRVGDRKLLKLKKSQLKPKDASQGATPVDPQQRLREEQQQWMTRFRTEILDMEDLIPWNGVTKSWKAKRGSWRKRILASLNLQDIGEGLKELLRCLDWDRDDRLGHSILKWEHDIDDMCCDASDFKKFSKLWRRLSNDIHKWIQDRATGTHLIDPTVSRRRAEFAWRRLKEAAADGERSLRQVPLETVLHDDSVALGHLKAMVATEKRRQGSATAPRKRPKSCTTLGPMPPATTAQSAEGGSASPGVGL